MAPAIVAAEIAVASAKGLIAFFMIKAPLIENNKKLMFI
jgi:hypothetical protein